MNALFVSCIALEANTSVSKSNLGLLLGLNRLGYDVTVVMPELDKGLSYFDSSIEYKEYIKDMVILKSNTLSSNVINKGDEVSGWKRKAYLFLRKVYLKTHLFGRTKTLVSQAKAIVDDLESYYDLIISTSDPKSSHLLAKAIINEGIQYEKWIQHWGDPLYGDITLSTYLPDFYVKRVEYNLLKDADTIVYVSPFTSSAQQSNHKTLSTKMVFVPLPCDTSIPLHSEKCNDYFQIVYLGDYNSKVRNIMPLYEAISYTHTSHPSMHLTIAGNSDLKLSENDNVTILPRISSCECSQYEKEADLIVCVCNLSGTQIPGKLYYLASSNKPILCIVDGDEKESISEYLNTFNRYYICNNHKDDIVNAISMIRQQKKVFETPKELLPEAVVNKMIKYCGD